MTGTIGSLDESQRDPLSLLAIMKTINAEKNIPFDVDKSGSAPSEKFPPSKSEPNLKPAISEEKSPDGDLYIKNGYLQSLALPGGEGMKIDKNGKISLYDEEGKSAGDGKITKGKDGFTIEFSNGISVTMASDGKQSIHYPSGASVIVNEKNMIESVQ